LGKSGAFVKDISGLEKEGNWVTEQKTNAIIIAQWKTLFFDDITVNFGKRGGNLQYN
jgi:hypothetical protein